MIIGRLFITLWIEKAVNASAHDEKVTCYNRSCYLDDGSIPTITRPQAKERTSICSVRPNKAALIVPSKPYEYAACAATEGATKMVEAKRIRISRLSLRGRSIPQSRYRGQMMRMSADSVLTKGNIRPNR